MSKIPASRGHLKPQWLHFQMGETMTKERNMERERKETTAGDITKEKTVIQGRGGERNQVTYESNRNCTEASSADAPDPQ